MDKHFKKWMDMFSFRVFLIVILIFTGILQFLLMLNNVRGVTYDIQAFQLAPETIRAVKTVEDTVKTEKERQAAEAAVEPVYVFDDEIAEHRVALIESIYEIVLDVRDEIEEMEEIPTKEEQIQLFRSKLKEITDSQSSLRLTDDQLWSLIIIEKNELNKGNLALKRIVDETLSNPIRKENLTTVRNEVETKIRDNENISQLITSAFVTIGRVAIVETEKLDEDKTQERIQLARESVEPTRILQGQIIVQEGELIDREIYRQLELLGVTNNQASMKPVIGLAILVLLQMSFLYFLFDRSKLSVNKNRQHLLVTVIVYLISIALMELISLLTDDFEVMIAFLYPTALTTMLVSLLANDKVASLVTVLTAASSGVIFHEGYSAVLQMDVALYILLGGFACIYFIRNMENRSDILNACGIVAVANLLFIAFYLLMS
ncbi:MAG: phosphohydrolase, partial [Lysinibacillus sp.]|nr:phosphohydrolase [Lysinibacillus sp.]